MDNNDYNAPPRRQLRRNKVDGMIGGVCAGIADYLGWDVTVTRLLTVALIIFTGVPVLAYFILWLFIPSDKRAPYVREVREEYRARKVDPINPARTSSYNDVKSKYRSLEVRLQDLEKSVTSKEWKLRRDFRDLEE